MGYKELIELSQKAANEWRGDHTFYQAGVLIDSLRTAIETLLKERDAAVESLSCGGGRCNCCAYNYHSIYDYPCKHCKETGGMSDYWEWRGPQKGDGHD